jgi:hypothetical protein
VTTSTATSPSGASVYFEPHCDFDEGSVSAAGPVDVVVSPVISGLLGVGPALYPLTMGDINLVRLLRALQPKVAWRCPRVCVWVGGWGMVLHDCEVSVANADWSAWLFPWLQDALKRFRAHPQSLSGSATDAAISCHSNSCADAASGCQQKLWQCCSEWASGNWCLLTVCNELVLCDHGRRCLFLC